MRILAGEFKGRCLLPPPGKSITRPITGMVKKSLFGMLGEDLSGWRVLDLYCGTGTLGIEALSRGAVHVCFAEMDRRVVERLRRNLADLRAAHRSTIWVGDVSARLAGWLGEVHQPVDLAFVDPPYAQARQWDWDDIGQRIFTPLATKLTDDGLAVLRLPVEAPLPDQIGPLAVIRRREYGGMAVALLSKPGNIQKKEDAND